MVPVKSVTSKIIFTTTDYEQHLMIIGYFAANYKTDAWLQIKIIFLHNFTLSIAQNNVKLFFRSDYD